MSSVVVYRSLAVLESLMHERIGQIEELVAKEKNAYLDVAEALKEIRDGKLYKEAGYATFELYCQRRWGFTKQTAYLYLRAGQVAEDVAPALPPGKVPNQMQARALAPLKSAEQRREVVKEFDDFEKAPVAKVQEAVRRKLDKPEPPPKTPTDVVLRVSAPEPNGHDGTAFFPFRLFPGFRHVEIKRDGRGYSTLAIWMQDAQAKKEAHYHDTDTAALAWVAAWLANHQESVTA